MKKIIITLLFSVVFFSNSLFASNTSVSLVTKHEEVIASKIEENNKLIRQKLKNSIENKLNFIEISEQYKKLNEQEKIVFYELQLKLVKEKLKNTKKQKEIEVYEIFIEKINARLKKLYGEKIEDEEVILALMSTTTKTK